MTEKRKKDLAITGITLGLFAFISLPFWLDLRVLGKMALGLLLVLALAGLERIVIFFYEARRR